MVLVWLQNRIVQVAIVVVDDEVHKVGIVHDGASGDKSGGGDRSRRSTFIYGWQ